MLPSLVGPGPISFIFVQFSAPILPKHRFLPHTQGFRTPDWEILGTPLHCFFLFVLNPLLHFAQVSVLHLLLFLNIGFWVSADCEM